MSQYCLYNVTPIVQFSNSYLEESQYCFVLFGISYLIYAYHSIIIILHHIGLLWSDVPSKDGYNYTSNSIFYQSLCWHLNQCIATSVPTELGCGNSYLEESQYHILSLTVFYKQTQTKTNNCTTTLLPTLTIHFVCKDLPIFPIFPIQWINIPVQNYHCQSPSWCNQVE